MRQLIVACVAITVAACGGTPAGPSLAPITVYGRVINFADNAGVSGATVAFGGVTAVADSAGAYTLTMPGPGEFLPTVNGVTVGHAHLVTPFYRGDLIVGGAGCVARYGTISDAVTHRAVSGAVVSLGAVSGIDGWYRVDLGCPPGGRVGFNTAFMGVTHPAYQDASEILGRGISGVSRMDVELQRR